MTKANTKDNVVEFEGLRLIGGQPGLNLVNTVKHRGAEEEGDRFNEFLDIIKWARLAELINEREYKRLYRQRSLPESIQLHQEICIFREHVRVILDIQNHGSSRLKKAIKYVERAISQLRPTITINCKTFILEKNYPITELKDLKFRIIASIDSLLQNLSLLTIKTCSGLDCDWLFADETKAKRRKWCDTRTCGNLSRVRKHRAN